MIDCVKMSSFLILLLSVAALGPLIAAQQTPSTSQVSEETLQLGGSGSPRIVFCVSVWPAAMPQSATSNGLGLQHWSAAESEKSHFCATELGSRPQPDRWTEVQGGVAGIQPAG